MKERSRIVRTIIDEIKKDIDLTDIKTFSDLHDVCDANVLGDSEAVLDNCSNTEDLNEELNAIQNVVDHYIKAIHKIAITDPNGGPLTKRLRKAQGELVRCFDNTDILITIRTMDDLMEALFPGAK